MTKSISERLQEIMRRESAATPGPWAMDYEVYEGLTTAMVKAEAIVQDYLTEKGYAEEIVRQPRDPKDPLSRRQVYQDGRFIAHARMDIPFLLELVSELQCELLDRKRADQA